jgi:hypothetical protein
VSTDVKAALAELNRKVLGREGVSGTAVGESGGAPCLLVYLSDAGARKGIPGRVSGVPVKVEVTGRFKAY